MSIFAPTSIEKAQNEFSENGLVVIDGLYTPEYANAALKDGFSSLFGRPRVLGDVQLSRQSCSSLKGSVLGLMIDRINYTSHLLGINVPRNSDKKDNTYLTEISANADFSPTLHGAVVVAPLERQLNVDYLEKENITTIEPGNVMFARTFGEDIKLRAGICRATTIIIDGELDHSTQTDER